jgi:hypothetical protein
MKAILAIQKAQVILNWYSSTEVLKAYRDLVAEIHYTPTFSQLRAAYVRDDPKTTMDLILWAAGDIGCELKGVPPYLSLTADAWFEPSPAGPGSR